MIGHGWFEFSAPAGCTAPLVSCTAKVNETAKATSRSLQINQSDIPVYRLVQDLIPFRKTATNQGFAHCSSELEVIGESNLLVTLALMKIILTKKNHWCWDSHQAEVTFFGFFLEGVTFFSQEKKHPKRTNHGSAVVNSAFGTFRRSGNGTPCTKTAATAPRAVRAKSMSRFVAGPTKSLYACMYVYIYIWNVSLHYSINYHYIPVLSKRFAKCDEVHPLCAPSSWTSTCPKPPSLYRGQSPQSPTARFFNCLLAGFGDSHINMAPTTNTRSLNSQISWGPKVVQDPKWNLGQPVHAVWKRKESAMNTTLWSFWLLWCFKNKHAMTANL